MLRSQLAARFGQDETALLLTEARERVEKRRDDPDFATFVEQLQKRRNPRGKYWSGPIMSRQHAERITKTTAGWFGGVSLLGLLPSLLTGRTDTSMLIAVLLFLIAAMALWKVKSMIAAGFFVAISGFSLMMLLLLPPLMGYGNLGSLSFAGLIWLPPLLAGLRAFKATRFLRRNRKAANLLLDDTGISANA